MNSVPQDKLVDARLTILEFRQDGLEQEMKELRKEYVEEHKALRISIQGVEKNLTAIKWITTGAVGAVVSQALGIHELLKALL